MNELLRGINALLVRQTMSWVSFLGFTSVFKEGTLRYKGRIEGNDILWIGVLVGIINTAVIMPADFIKTHQQKFREINKGGLWGAYRLLTEKEATGIGKIRVIYCGWRVRVVHYMFNAVFTVGLIDHLEKKFSSRE